MDGRKRQAAGQAAGGGAGIHPGQLEGHQRQRQVLGPFDEAALVGVHEDAGDAGFVEGLEQGLLFGGPFVGVAGACGYQAGHRAARHGAHGLHQHLQVVAVGEAPQDLADIVARQGAQVLGGVLHRSWMAKQIQFAQWEETKPTGNERNEANRGSRMVCQRGSLTVSSVARGGRGFQLSY